MHRPPLKQIIPSKLEFLYVIFFSCFLILAGNGKLILERAGLITSAHLIGQQVSMKVLWGTNWLDNFSYTAGAINLVIWGATGLVIYSVLQSIVHSIRTIEYQRDFDTRLFIHPQNYTHQSYWKHLIADSVLGFILLTLLLIGVIAYIFIIVPNSFIYAQRFIFEPNVRHSIDPFISLVLTFVGTGIVYILLKLVIRHHRITTVIE